MPTLDWLNKAQALKTAAQVPYRLLEPQSVHGDPAADNWLIQGDNLDALKSLLPFFAGSVKCIYIDPPYNTRSAFEHYDDIAGFATDATIGSNPRASRQPRFDHYSMNWR